MEILKTGVAGTLESGDIYIEIEGGDGIVIELESTVKSLYGRQIKEVITKTLQGMGVKGARVTANDKGALDCTVEARVKSAVHRAADTTDYGWSTEGRRA